MGELVSSSCSLEHQPDAVKRKYTMLRQLCHIASIPISPQRRAHVHDVCVLIGGHQVVDVKKDIGKTERHGRHFRQRNVISALSAPPSIPTSTRLIHVFTLVT